MISQLQVLPDMISRRTQEVENCQMDIDFAKESKTTYSREELKEIGRQIVEGLKNNDYKIDETKICEYQGFDVILPAGMTGDNPYIYVQKNCRYKLPCKLTEIGVTTRLKNLLDSLHEKLAEFELAKNRLESKYQSLQEELAKPKSFGDRIAQLKKQLESIDNKLGVKNYV